MIHSHAIRCAQVAKLPGLENTSKNNGLLFSRVTDPRVKRPVRVFLAAESRRQVKALLQELEAGPKLEIYVGSLSKSPGYSSIFDEIKLYADAANILMGFGKRGARLVAHVEAQRTTHPSALRCSFVFEHASLRPSGYTSLFDGAAKTTRDTMRSCVGFKNQRTPRIRRIRRVGNTSNFTVTGAGISGIFLARKILLDGHQCVVLERESGVGGVWHTQANSSSKVNTSEAAYRIAERGSFTNFDHTPASQILADLAFVSSAYLSQ